MKSILSLIIGFHSIQTVDHVIYIVFLMGSRISQCDEWIEFFQSFLCLLPLNRLRFINNQDRIRLSNNVNRTTASEFVQLHINSSCVLTLGIEGLYDYAPVEDLRERSGKSIDELFREVFRC